MKTYKPSVGIVTVERPCSSGPPGGVERRDPSRRHNYDRRFEQAIAEGHLTIAQAVARGDRHACATALERRNGLSTELALQVADNRIRLNEAVRRSQLDALILSDMPRVARDRRGTLTTVTLVVFALMLAGIFGVRRLERQAAVAREAERRSFANFGVGSGPAAVPGTPAPAFVIDRDPAGNVTRVSAGRPTAVVEGLCRAFSRSDACWQSEVHETEPRRPGRRVGRFVGADVGQAFSVQIRRDRSTGRWVAGTGLRPITLVTDNGHPIAAPVHPDAAGES